MMRQRTFASRSRLALTLLTLVSLLFAPMGKMPTAAAATGLEEAQPCHGAAPVAMEDGGHDMMAMPHKESRKDLPRGSCCDDNGTCQTGACSALYILRPTMERSSLRLALPSLFRIATRPPQSGEAPPLQPPKLSFLA